MENNDKKILVLGKSFPEKMERKLWTHCPTCMTQEDHDHDPDGWRCERCKNINPNIGKYMWD